MVVVTSVEYTAIPDPALFSLAGSGFGTISQSRVELSASEREGGSQSGTSGLIGLRPKVC